jgi:flap endonuclease-1
MTEHKFENYFGRKIAVDASMHIYAFLVRPPLPPRPRRSAPRRLPPAMRPSRRCRRLANSMGALQVVVGRQGDQMLTSETGEVTRWVPPPSLLRPTRAHPAAAVPPPLTPRAPPSRCSHLLGMFFRTARMLEAGMRPV